MRKYHWTVCVILGMVWCSGCGFLAKSVPLDPAPETVAADDGTDRGDPETEEAFEMPSETMRETQPQEGQSLPWLVMVNSELYRYLGEFADADLRCGMMDGEITFAVPENEVPAQNNTSNFGAGYGYQYGAENEIQIHMPCGETEELHWLRFGKCAPFGEGREDILLKEPPQLIFQDALSSTFEFFSVPSIGYTWYYEENGEMSGIAACGAHPLDDAELIRTPVLQIPQYNRLEEVPFFCSGAVEPDTLTVRKWEMSALGHSDAEPLTVLSYEGEMSLLELEAGFVYGILAEWKEENFDKNGFYGAAEYAFVTK